MKPQNHGGKKEYERYLSHLMIGVGGVGDGYSLLFFSLFSAITSLMTVTIP